MDKLPEPQKDQTNNEKSKLNYGLTDVPPWHLTILFALQLILMNLASCIVMSIVITNVICADSEFTSKLFTTTTFMSGLTTIFQTLVGVRLPIFQGPTLLGVLPYMDAKADPRWRCGMNMTEYYILNNETMPNTTQNAWDQQWSKVQGSMLIGMLIEAVLGMTGLVGLISRVIRPVSIAVIFILLGVYLWEVIADLAEPHWGIAMMSCVLMIIFALYLNKVQVPVLAYNKTFGFYRSMFPLFELYPIILTILICWAITHIITVSGGFTSDPTQAEYKARTDIHADNIENSPPFRWPYPGQFGGIDFDANYMIFYIPCMLASMTESIADYYAYAQACEAPPPAVHAMNRGILIEGIGGMISAGLGAGHPTTSYSNMMGVITITKVGNRVVMICAGVGIIIVGLIGPLAALLVSIPTPIMFGTGIISVAFLTGSGFSNLQTVDVASRRNQAILGVSVFFACVVSFWIKKTPNPIRTGSLLFNDVAAGILKIHFLVGGIVAVFLDMTLSGKKKEKILFDEENDEVLDKRMYYPPLLGEWMRQREIFRYIPFLPGPKREKKQQIV